MRGLAPKIAFLSCMLSTACSTGGGSAGGSAAPADPTETVRAFLSAVERGDLNAMANLWGSRDGPASRSMPERELNQRLTVIQVYLEHDEYEFVEPGTFAIAGDSSRRGVGVRLRRSGCEAVVPFTLVPWSGGWLVNDIDLAPIGNPARACPQGS